MNIFIPTYKDRFRLVNRLGELPAGTVFAIERVKLNKTTKMSEYVGLRVLASPDSKFAMKKYGGDCEGGHHFSLTIERLRSLEVELVEGMA